MRMLLKLFRALFLLLNLKDTSHPASSIQWVSALKDWISFDDTGTPIKK